MICKNCGKECDDNYCPSCGQKVATQRLSLPSMLHNILLGILNCDKGILLTIKFLFTRPGYMILEYLEGKRIRYFAPFQMLFILAAIYVLLYNILGLESVFESVYKKLDDSQVLYWFLHFSQKYIAFLWLSMIPVTVILYRWIYGKRFRKTYNWAETLFIGAYIQSQQAIIAIASLPFFYMNKIFFFSSINNEYPATYTSFSSIVNTMTLLLSLVLATWTFRQIKGGSWLRNLLQMLVIHLLFYFTVIIITATILIFCIINRHVIF